MIHSEKKAYTTKKQKHSLNISPACNFLTAMHAYFTKKVA